MVYNGILMETIGISVMVSIGLLLFFSALLLTMFTQDLMESADNERSRLLLEKAEAETKKRKAEAELQSYMDEDDNIFDKFNTDLKEVQVSLET